MTGKGSKADTAPTGIKGNKNKSGDGKSSIYQGTWTTERQWERAGTRNMTRPLTSRLLRKPGSVRSRICSGTGPVEEADVPTGVRTRTEAQTRQERGR